MNSAMNGMKDRIFRTMASRWGRRGLALLALLFLPAVAGAATTYYVSQSGDNSDGLSWGTAYQTIQAALNGATSGDTVMVADGTYNNDYSTIGGGGILPSAIVVPAGVTVQSQNGPAGTTIVGDPGYQGGGRCAYLGTNAVLSGFTLSGGYTLDSSGSITTSDWCGGGVFCEDSSAVVTNCAITGNTAIYGGGAALGTLRNCILSVNTANPDQGGGADGGGAYGSTLYNCTLNGNTAYNNGGGACGDVDTLFGGLPSVLNNCTLTTNTASVAGGGSSASTLRNCTLTGNTASSGGGSSASALLNCTLTGNAATSGGGSYQDALTNCIVYYNTAGSGPNVSVPNSVDHCCAPDGITAGVNGNINGDPRMASLTHISADSPCLHSGLSGSAVGVDMDGDLWNNPPSIGADEYVPASCTGDLTVAVGTLFTNVAANYAVAFTSLVQGAAASNVWDFGDGSVLNNDLVASHAWASGGSYTVTLTAYNADHPAGVQASVTVTVLAAASSVHYVNAANATPVAPYLSWADAATNIQEAIDVCVAAGERVWVTNGVYDTGGRTAGTFILTNRVTVDRPITVRSVNGPGVTIIKGAGPIGEGAVRCAYVGPNAVLAGFTLTNGATHYATGQEQDADGGGAFCDSLSLVSNCVFVGNSAVTYGGGACNLGTIRNCTFVGNSVAGGSYAKGGGVACPYGGGILYNCLLTANSAEQVGGGAFKGTLVNCTLTGNSATLGAGGAYGEPGAECKLYNCIVYNNSAGAGAANYSGCLFAYGCTTPDPGAGLGNITDDPNLLSDGHLPPTSPCTTNGNFAYCSGVDLDGNTWSNPPSMGCYQFVAGATGSVTVAISAAETNFPVGYVVTFQAVVTGSPDGITWNFGDGTVVTNNYNPSHPWSATGAYDVVLSGWIGTQTNTATLTVHVTAQDVRYVSLAGSHSAGFTSWATAATTIQDAIDACSAGGLVLVSNGTFSVGGRTNGLGGTLTNRIVVTRGITVRGAFGRENTIIAGAPDPATTNGPAAVRCAYLASGTMLADLTLSNGCTAAVEGDGGGVYVVGSGAILTNCVLVGNKAIYHGGGAYGGTLYNCLLTGNTVLSYGAGASDSTLYNCTVSGNSAGNTGGGAYGGTLYNGLLTGNSAGQVGGGAYGSTLYNCTVSGNSAGSTGGGLSGGSLTNCIVYFNTAPSSPNADSPASAGFSCAPDGVVDGVNGNITNPPLFMNTNAGNYRLRANSPCVDAGTNQSWMTGTLDLAGNARVVNSRVDMGAYEFGSEIYVCITNPSVTVNFNVATYAIGGLAGYVNGVMSWTNALSGGAGTFAAVSPWSVAGIGLPYGTNVITVSGTNSAGASASDAVTIIRPAPVPGAISNLPPSNFGVGTATLNGYLVSTGDSPATVYAFWGPNDGATSATAWSNVGAFAVGQWGAGQSVWTNLAGLAPAKYYYTFAVSNGAGLVWGVPTNQLFNLIDVTVTGIDLTCGATPSDTATITIARPVSATADPLTVNFAYSGTATQGVHFTVNPSGTSLTLAAGQASTNIVFTPQGPPWNVAGDRSITVTLGSGSYVIGTPSNITCTLVKVSTAIFTWDGSNAAWTNGSHWTGGAFPGMLPANGSTGIIASGTALVTTASSDLYNPGSGETAPAEIRIATNGTLRYTYNFPNGHSLNRDHNLVMDGGTFFTEYNGSYGYDLRVNSGSTFDGNGLFLFGKLRDLDGTHSGQLKVTGTGSGRLWLYGANAPFTGGWLVQGGLVIGMTNQAFGTGDIVVTNGGTVAWGGYTDVPVYRWGDAYEPMPQVTVYSGSQLAFGENGHYSSMPGKNVVIKDGGKIGTVFHDWQTGIYVDAPITVSGNVTFSVDNRRQALYFTNDIVNIGASTITRFGYFNSEDGGMFVGKKDSSYTGNWIVVGPTLTAMDDGALGTGTVELRPGTALSISQGLTFHNVISGNGTLGAAGRTLTLQPRYRNATLTDAGVSPGSNAVYVTGVLTNAGDLAFASVNNYNGSGSNAYCKVQIALATNGAGVVQASLVQVLGNLTGLSNADLVVTAPADLPYGTNTIITSVNDLSSQAFHSATFNRSGQSFRVLYVGSSVQVVISAPYTLTYTTDGHGTISGTTPQTVVYGANGSSVTAVPDTGYHFVNWSDGVGAASRQELNVVNDTNVMANFAINSYTLTYRAGAGGSLSGTTNQTLNYGGTGTVVTVVPDSGFNFLNWSDGATSSNREDGPITNDVNVTATFHSSSGPTHNGTVFSFQ